MSQEPDVAEMLESCIRGGQPVERLVDTWGVKGPNKTPDAH